MASSSEPLTSIMVHLDRSYFEHQISNGALVSYIDSEGVTLFADRSLEVSMQKPKEEESTIVMSTNTIVKGTIISYERDYVTYQDEDGSTVRTKYISIRSPPKVPPNSYIIIYNDEGLSKIPKLRYMSRSVTWTPILRLKMYPGIPHLSLDAVIISHRDEPLKASFTLEAFDEDQSSKPFMYEPGTFTLTGKFTYPTFNRNLKMVDRVNFVDLDLAGPGVQEGLAKVGYIFVTPFGFPKCQLEINDHGYIGTQQVTAHQRGQLVAIRTHQSYSIKYKSSIESRMLDATRVLVEMSVEILQDGLETENLLFILHVGDLPIEEVVPTTTTKLEIPKKLVWKGDTDMSRKFTNRIVYRIPEQGSPSDV